MTSRSGALALATLAIVLTVLQDALPGRDWYHGWQYVAVLAIAIAALALTGASAWRGADGLAGRVLVPAYAGALAVAVAGLLSGLIGPDDIIVVGTPGTVTPVPDVAAAAFFPAATPASLQAGDPAVVLRRRDAPAIEVGPAPHPLGLTVVQTLPHPAGYVVARDARGAHLTVTQPNNASFLSPVILFRASQPIRDRVYPMDTIGVPALHRVVRLLYFSAADLASFRHAAGEAVAGDGAVISVTDDAGKPLGITIAPSGREIAVGDLRLTVTLGTYPQLRVASAPQPFVVIGGIVLFAFGCVQYAVVLAKTKRSSLTGGTTAA